MAVKNIEKWLGFQFSSGPYVGDDYKSFQRDAKACLKKVSQSINPHHGS